MPDQPIASTSSHASILAVDDDAMHRRLLQLQLKTLGYSVDFAVNGAEALQRWRAGNYMLVFTDLHMPIMDGFDLAAAIRREEQPQRRAPIYALTGSASPHDRDRARAVGITDCLEKPVDLSQLGQLLDQVPQLAMKRDAKSRLQEA